MCYLFLYFCMFLAVIQEQMGGPKLKLLQEIDTRWNSTFHMLQGLVELNKPVAAAMACLQTDIPGLTSDKSSNVTACLSILSLFHGATVELSEEKTSVRFKRNTIIL